MNVFTNVSPSIAIAAVLYAIWSSSLHGIFSASKGHASRQPIVYIPNQEKAHLEHVEEAFARAGYQLMTNENASDMWHAMWTFHNPFWQREPSVDLPEIMTQIKAHQKINHIPGAGYFTSKIELAKHGEGFSFIPRSFLLPRQYTEFVEYQKRHQNASWVKKGAQHRGVQLIDPSNPILAESSETESIVQEFIHPYLVDKCIAAVWRSMSSLCSRLWDVGLYVAITSVYPLRLYTFDNILVRACPEEFESDLARASRDAYVVGDDYLPPWGMPSFRHYYTWGMSTLNVLRAFFHGEGGLEFDEIFTQMKASVLELIGSYVETLKKAAEKYPHGQNNFYSMYRVDFIIDRNLKPWITEVNQSPNLSSKHFADLSTMFQRISYSLLSLVGLVPGGMHHPHSNEKDLEILFHTNDVDIGYALCSKCNQNCRNSPRCSLCRPCRTPQQTILLKEIISEQRSRLGFIPLYPLRNSTLSVFGHLTLDGEDHALQQYFVIEKCQQDYTWC